MPGPVPQFEASSAPISQYSIDNIQSSIKRLGPGRLELPTSRLSGVRSSQLSYEPQTIYIVNLILKIEY